MIFDFYQREKNFLLLAGHPVDICVKSCQFLGSRAVDSNGEAWQDRLCKEISGNTFFYEGSNHSRIKKSFLLFVGLFIEETNSVS